MSNPDVGAGIVNNNAGQRLLACVTALNDQGVREIVVVDNRSTDGSIAMLHANFPNIPVITLPHQLGFGPAMNRAVNELTNEFVVCLDAHAVVGAGAIDQLVGRLTSDENVGCVGPDLAVSQSEHCHLKDTQCPPDDNARIDRRRFHAGSGGAVSGAVMVVRRRAYVLAGGFDERSFMYDEDAEFNKRLRSRGFDVVTEQAPVEITGRSERLTVGTVFRHHRALFRYYRMTTHGLLGKLALPFLAVGLAIRFPLAFVHQRLVRSRRRATRRVNLDQPEQTRQRH